MKDNKAKRIGPWKVVSASNGGLFKFLYKVNGKFINTIVYTHSSLSGFVENLYC